MPRLAFTLEFGCEARSAEGGEVSSSSIIEGRLEKGIPCSGAGVVV